MRVCSQHMELNYVYMNDVGKSQVKAISNSDGKPGRMKARQLIEERNPMKYKGSSTRLHEAFLLRICHIPT